MKNMSEIMLALKNGYKVKNDWYQEGSYIFMKDGVIYIRNGDAKLEYLAGISQLTWEGEWSIFKEKPKPTEMTIAELEKKLGISNLKIVK